MHLRVDLLLHVVVLVLDVGLNGVVAVFLLHLGHTFLDEVLAVFKAIAVVVADDVGEGRLFDVALYAQQVVESLVAFGLLGCLAGGQHLRELHSQTVGIHHLAFRIARMDTHALATDFCRCGIEILELQLSKVASIDGVSPVASELLHIEVVGSHANLLIGVERHANLSVLNLLVVAQEADGLHDFGNACLVVGSEQRGAIGDDEVLAYVLEQFGELLGAADDALREQDVAAIVVVDDARMDIGSRAVGAGVVVGDEADGGRLLLGVGLQRGVDVALVVHLDIAQAFVLEFFFQILGEYELFRRTGHTLRVFARLCVELGIVQKPFGNVHVVGCNGVFRVNRVRSRLILAVVNVVALGGSQCGLEVGDAILHEDVVPLDELLDVAVVYAVAIEVGQHLGEILLEFLSRTFLIIKGALFRLLLLTHVLQHLPKGDVVGVGEHGDVGKARHTVGGECWHAFVCFVECFYDEIHFSTAHQSEKSRLAGD